MKIDTQLFRNKMFMLDEIVKRNAPKLALFLECENPNSFFSFFILSDFGFGFVIVDALIYVDIDQGFHC